MQEAKRDHNVYILGAGFSAEAGYPLIRNFIDRIRDSYENPDISLSQELLLDYRTVIDYRSKLRSSRDYIDLDLDNIETLFSLMVARSLSHNQANDVDSAIRRVIANEVSTSDCLGGRHILRVDKDSVRSTHKDLISEVSNGFFPPDAKNPEAKDKHCYLDSYHYFAALIGKLVTTRDSKNIKDTVITFNYDVELDCSLLEMGIPISYGFGNPLGLDDGSHAEVISVLKPHGSVNWALGSAEPTISFPERNRFENNPLLIPPTWSKAPGPWLQEIWGQCMQAISSATRIVVIGYSLPETDLHVKHMLAAGLSESKGLHKLIVVDLNNDVENPINSRYKSLFRPLDMYSRYKYFGGGFSDFLYYGSTDGEYSVGRGPVGGPSREKNWKRR